MQKRPWAVLALAAGVLTAPVSGQAAGRLPVYRAQLTGAMGADYGNVVMSRDELIFVDETNPAVSFSIPRPEIRALNMAGGVLRLSLARPFTDLYGSREDASLRFLDPASPDAVSAWAGMPLVSEGAALQAGGVAMPPTTFEVRHDGHAGRLIVDETRLAFEPTGSGGRPRSWAYGQVKEFKREGSEYDYKLKTYDGEEFKFRLLGERGMAIDIYNLIADRIIAARRPR